MKLALLTTPTLHHLYFCQEISHHFPVGLIIGETESLSAPFDTNHSYLVEQETYEREHWFANGVPEFSQLAPYQEVTNINAPESSESLQHYQPDLIIVFGTRKIQPELIALCPQGFLNLHGGDPEQYRGLDSHLWGIYHRDFKLLTTLHRLNKELDDGEIIIQAQIPFRPNMRLAELRAANTQICVELCLAAISMYQQLGKMISRPQRHKGRYYSFMPTDLKTVCQQRFETYTSRL